MLLNGNSLHENGIIINYIDSAICQASSFSWSNLSFWIFREHSRGLMRIQLMPECPQVNSLPCHWTVSASSPEKFIKLFVEQGLSLWLEPPVNIRSLGRRDQINITFNFGKRARFSFSLRSIVSDEENSIFSFSIFVSRVVLRNSITHEGNWTESSKYHDTVPIIP